MTELQSRLLSTVQKLVSTFFWQLSCVVEKVTAAHQHHTFRSSDPLHLLHNLLRRTPEVCMAAARPQATASITIVLLEMRSLQTWNSGQMNWKFHSFEPAKGYFQINQTCSCRFKKYIGSTSLTQNPLVKASCISLWHWQKCIFSQK